MRPGGAKPGSTRAGHWLGDCEPPQLGPGKAPGPAARAQVIGWENIELISDRPLEVMLEDMARLKAEYPGRRGPLTGWPRGSRAAWRMLAPGLRAMAAVRAWMLGSGSYPRTPRSWKPSVKARVGAERQVQGRMQRPAVTKRGERAEALPGVQRCCIWITGVTHCSATAFFWCASRCAGRSCACRVLIASIMEEYDRPAWEQLIERCEAAGVDGFEINFSCPHGMPERRMGMAMGQDCELLKEVCGWINAKATVPVWAKMTPNITCAPGRPRRACLLHARRLALPTLPCTPLALCTHTGVRLAAGARSAARVVCCAPV